ncbi:MAG TPA: tRNA pseudouridine(38-40) synthase TruA [Blastocatellia bacterium]|nr:tRNA pseudouridine(38-40) synthase TruA [Blastocatellia bacterium]
MPVWKLTIEYEGTRYRGWQEQPDARTIAGELRSASEKVLGGRVDITGAGRTDAGVHALAQVARLSAARRLKPEQLQREINAELPADINVLRVENAEPSFDPRRDATARYYLYQISRRRTAFAKRFVWWVRDDLNVEAMRKASNLLSGQHDFANFCEGRDDKTSTIVVVERAELETAGDLILFRIGASHFLWKMVRRIVGTIVEVGAGKLEASVVERLLAPARQGSRKRVAELPFDVAAHTAPPSGLFLEKVVYRRGEHLDHPKAACQVLSAEC